MRIENSFIIAPGVGRKTEKKYWKKGLHTWDELRESGEASDRVHEFLDRAHQNLKVGNTVFFEDKLPSKDIWRIYRNFSEDACFFDIETTGLDKNRNKVTTASFYKNGKSETLVRGKDLTAERIQEIIFDSSMVVSFNGKRFDQPFLEHNFDVEFNTPHIDLMYPAKSIGLSGGLKKIEKDLGIDRELEDVDGREAVRLWKKYEKKNDTKALEKLVLYNEYDARNLETLMEMVHERLTSKFFRPYVNQKENL